MSAVAPSPLPRWDLTAAFPSLDSTQYTNSVAALVGDTEDLSKALDEAEAAGSVDEQVAHLDSLIKLFNEIHFRSRTLTAFVMGYVTVDSRDDYARAKDSELDNALIPLAKCNVRFTAWIGSLPLEEILSNSQIARDHEYMLRKALVAARHLMSPTEESLAAELAPTASIAWTKLHGSITSQIEVEVELNGRRERMPMSKIRTLAYDSDREVRRAGYEAELEAWTAHEAPVAAALNGVKGTVSTLAKRRGWGTPLDEALYISNIDRSTLDAMMLAAREALVDYRRYLRAKARALGIERMAFYDIFAPIAGAGRDWIYEEATRFVAANFRKYSGKLADYAERTFRENWIDAEPRPGKRDGAFCMGLIDEQSRILLNFKESFGSVKTLAHELGHGYHNLCLSSRTMLQRRTPMTLAETASIFCETIIQSAALEEASGSERLLILQNSLDGTCQTTVDIMSRFLFEERVFEGRANRELSAKEFCDLMLESQRETYGDALNQEFLHPYMWAVKPHYYSRSFYNFPYMYGMLFGLGLYSLYRTDPEGFKVRYDDLLSSTGLADAANLAKRFGFDVTTPDFWRSSFNVIREQIELFEGQFDRFTYDGTLAKSK